MREDCEHKLKAKEIIILLISCSECGYKNFVQAERYIDDLEKDTLEKSLKEKGLDIKLS